jgi:hypothetical protein
MRGKHRGGGGLGDLVLYGLVIGAALAILAAAVGLVRSLS